MFGGTVNVDLPHASMFSSLLLTMAITLTVVIALAILGRVLRVNFTFAFAIFISYVIFATSYGFLYGDLGSAADGFTYDRQAMTIADGWMGGEGLFAERDVSEGKEGFQYILAAIYYLGGRAPFAGSVFNCGLVAISAMLIASTSKRLYGDVNYSVLLVSFLTWPVFLIMGPTILREPLCWFGLSVMAFGLSIWKSNWITGSVLVTSAVMLLWWVRMPLGMMALIGMISAVVFIVLRSIWGRWGIGLSIIISFIVLHFYSADLLEVTGNDAERLDVVRGALSRTADSAYGVNSGVLEGVFGDVGFILANFPHILLGPFPWELSGSPVWLFVLTSSLHWLVILCILWWVMRNQTVDNVTVVFIITALVMLMGMGASLTNYGIVVRMRGLPATLLLVVVAGQPLNMFPDWLISKRKDRDRVSHMGRSGARTA